MTVQALGTFTDDDDASSDVVVVTLYSFGANPNALRTRRSHTRRPRRSPSCANAATRSCHIAPYRVLDPRKRPEPRSGRTCGRCRSGIAAAASLADSWRCCVPEADADGIAKPGPGGLSGKALAPLTPAASRHRRSGYRGCAIDQPTRWGERKRAVGTPRLHQPRSSTRRHPLLQPNVSSPSRVTVESPSREHGLVTSFSSFRSLLFQVLPTPAAETARSRAIRGAPGGLAGDTSRQPFCAQRSTPYQRTTITVQRAELVVSRPGGPFGVPREC